jgi:RNA polymerase sigma-70 factor, ECF subfamily
MLGEAALDPVSLPDPPRRRPLPPPRARRVARMDPALASSATPTEEDAGTDDDASLMRAYAAGDVRAFERLYARHRTALYRYLMRQTRDRSLTDDLFQETWSKLVTARSRYEPRAKFQTWLFTLAYHCFIDHCRRTQARPIGTSHNAEGEPLVDLIAAPQQGPEADASDAQTKLRLRTALDALPAEQRDAFLLYEQSDLSLEDIARVTGVLPETAKSRLRYAVAKLRAAMKPVLQAEGAR